MSLDQIPAQRSKQATKRTAKATNTNKYINATKLLLKNVLAESFFPVLKQSDYSESVENFLKYAPDEEDGSDTGEKTI